MMESNAYTDDYEFIEPLPEDLTCPVTLGLLIDPYQLLPCGHHLSAEVVTIQSSCPVCKSTVEDKVRNRVLQKKVLELMVRCKLRPQGCQWKGPLGDLQMHLSLKDNKESCQYIKITCPTGCGQEVRLGKLEEHKMDHCMRREHRCLYCGLVSNYRDMCDSHLPKCASERVPCPNDCGKLVKQSDVKKHCAICPNEMIACDYDYTGCKVKLKRKDVSQHAKDGYRQHLDLLISSSHQLLPTVKSLASMNKQLKSFKSVPDIIFSKYPKFKLENFISWYNDGAEPCFSPAFYSHFGGYKMCLLVERHEGYLSVGVKLLKGEFDDDLCFPLSGCITIQLVSRCVGNSHWEKVLELNDLMCDDIALLSDYISLECLLQKNGNSFYLTSGFVLKLHVINIILGPIASSVTNHLPLGPLFCSSEQLIEHLEHYPHTVLECDLCFLHIFAKCNAQNHLNFLSQYLYWCHGLSFTLKARNGVLQKVMSRSVGVFSQVPEFIMNNFMHYYQTDSSWFSKPFYTFYGGYKLLLRVDGYGYEHRLGTHLCVVLYVMKGEFDNDLKFPFLGSITVELIDQSSTHCNFSSTIEFHNMLPEAVSGKPKKKRNQGFGRLNFIPLPEILDGGRYLKDNCLKIKISKIVLTK